MKIDFADSFGQMRDQREHPAFDHAAAPGQAENMIVGAKSRSPQSPSEHRVPGMVGRCTITLPRKSLAEHTDRLRRDAHRLHPVLTTDLNDHGGDTRMKVHV